MHRRTFIGMTAALAVPRTLRAYPRQRAILLRGGTVYDGTGAAPVVTDLLIRGDRIDRIGRNLTDAGAEIIDVRNLAIAPGFIDIHSHTNLVSQPRAESKVRQGVTTEIVGQDGSSSVSGEGADFTSPGGYLRQLEQREIAVNIASMVGTGTLRGRVVGNADRPATAAELDTMKRHVRQAVLDGACGLSSGLEYTPGGFADAVELAALAGELRGTGLPYASHMRNEDDRLFAAIEEALFVGRVAGVPVHISHLKAQGQRNWWKADVAFEMIERARAEGIDVHFDRYPYVAYATNLSNLFPIRARDGGNAAFLARLRDPAEQPHIETYVRDKVAQLGSWDAVMVTSADAEIAWARGRRLGQLAAERGAEPYALLREIMFAGGGGMVGFGMSEENTAKILAHPLGMICSDAGASSIERGGSVHPRAYGSFPRVLGHYVREQRVMPLETAIHKMSGMPAAKLRLPGRGRIAPGAFADVVAFDPDTVADRATFEQPHAYPTGIAHVLVNGAFVVRAGDHTGTLPGRVLRPDPRG
jgi:N-acyl-D-amino-acid deacylase